MTLFDEVPIACQNISCRTALLNFDASLEIFFLGNFQLLAMDAHLLMAANKYSIYIQVYSVK